MEREVLVVESNAELADVIRQMVQHLGVSARVATTAARARHEMNPTPPALVLLGMATRGGRGLIRTLKADPITAAIPLVGLTFVGLMTCAEAFEAGVDDCVDKLEFAQLERVLRRFRLIRTTGG